MKKLSTPEKVGIGFVAASLIGGGVWWATRKPAANAAATPGSTGKKLTGADFDKNTSNVLSLDMANGLPTMPLSIGDSFFLAAPQLSGGGNGVVTGVVTGPELDAGPLTPGGMSKYPLIAIAAGSGKITGTFADDINGTNSHTFEIPYTVK